MVKNTNEHTRKAPAKQGAQTSNRKPMKIGASTPYDFEGSNMTAYGGLVAGDHDAGEIAIPTTDRRAPDDPATHHFDAWFPLRAGDGFGPVCGIFAPQPPALLATRTHAHWNFGCGNIAGAEHVLAFSDVAAS